ncbi:TIP41-like family-domain-containing protein [Aspergillus granulosus]|uniref:TIP41-like family-domain-containing protein n=1 Tax=Aspergillus granulosus TaxID=176169 RepID=A0ABR4H6U8_9EURO
MTSHSRTAPFPITGNTAAVSPTSQRPDSITVNGFKISTQKLPILKAEPIEAMTKNLGIAPPEMIFGDNFVAIEHKSGWGINFNAFDALDRVDKTGESMLKVAYSREWQKSREATHEGIKDVVKPFDWSYSTDYKGSVISTQGHDFEETSTPIPIELLKRPDPILFFDEVILYEDELADNGISMLSCKIRVMPGRLLLLSRFFMRLDNVLLRLRDTRLYIDFQTSEVTREYQSRECEYEAVRQKLAHARDDIPAIMRDPNRLSELLPVIEKRLERVSLAE